LTFNSHSESRKQHWLGPRDISRVSPGTVLASQLVPGQDGNLSVFTRNKGLWRLITASVKSWFRDL